MEEVVGSIPTRSTNYLLILSSFWRPFGSLSLLRRVLKFCCLRRQHHLNHLRVRFPFLPGYGTGIDIERRPATRMPQQFLRHFYVDAQCSQIRRQRMASRFVCPQCRPVPVQAENSSEAGYPGSEVSLPLSRIEGKRRSASVA